jgi:RNA polymerase sigma-70 factor (ECF subfamily)
MHNYKLYTDNELFLLLKENDEKAFEALYDRYWDKLLTQAFFKLNVREDAEEIVQEVFLNIWRKRHTIHLRNTFNTYISSIVKYEILSKIAIQKDKKIIGTEDRLYFVEDHTTCQFIDYQLLQDQIESTVQSLPDKCKLVFKLSRNTGLSEKDIAKKLNISIKTVQAHITKALKALRKSLSQLVLFY